MGAHKARRKEGDVFADRYRLEGILGKGGMGVVYRATDLRSGGAVALKVLQSNFGTSETDRRRFQREAALVQGLEHPNVVRLDDFGEDEGRTAYIAFELLEGNSLANALELHGPLDLHLVRRIAIDVLSALAVAHERGIVHRDIKPQNIFLLDRAPWTKVLDFGVGKVVKNDQVVSTQLTEAGEVVGTPHYMAPEQVRGEEVRPATDLYALGLVLVEALTDERVVQADGLLNIYLAHMSPERVTLDPRVLASPLGPILFRATGKTFDERYPSAQAMLADLERLPPDSGWRLRSEDSTLQMRAIEVSPASIGAATRVASRPGSPKAAGTLVMEDPDSDVVSSSAGNGGLRAMDRLGGSNVTGGGARPRQSSGIDALVATPASQPAPNAIWGSQGRSPHGAWSMPSSASGPSGAPASPGSPYPPSTPYSGPSGTATTVPQPPPSSALAPPSSRGLRAAVALVFVLIVAGVGVAGWLWFNG